MVMMSWFDSGASNVQLWPLGFCWCVKVREEHGRKRLGKINGNRHSTNTPPTMEFEESEA